MVQYVEWLHNLGMGDVERVGGKNASLGEMIANLSAAGVRVPGGFATTADAYREFLAHGGLKKRIDEAIGRLDVEDTLALSRTGEEIRGWIAEAPLQKGLESAIRETYQALVDEQASESEINAAVAQWKKLFPYSQRPNPANDFSGQLDSVDAFESAAR